MDERELQIIVVDDDPFVLKLLSHQLASLGCRAVTTFERAQAALEHIDTSDVPIDMLFCDLDMPQMDAVEFVRKLVHMPFAAGLVLVSGEDERVLRAAEKIADADVEASSLTLELTESRLMRDRRSSLDILVRLRLKGIGLSIDDFGTGHSSLVQLRDLPFDELKIDRSFVHGSEHDRSLRAIFNGNVAMAGQLDMRIVAEGVEDVADWNFLRASGCSLAQGHFIGRPMRPEALASWSGVWQERYQALASSSFGQDRRPGQSAPPTMPARARGG